MTIQDREIYMRLIIKERGHVLNIPGFSTLRTPCKINVDTMDLKILVSHLRQIGVSNYTIEENHDLNDDFKKRPILTKVARVIKAIKDEPDIIIKRVDDIGTKIELDKMSKKIDQLQSMLEQVLSLNKGNLNVKSDRVLKSYVDDTKKQLSMPIPKNVYKNQVVEELDDMDFIPEITFDDMDFSKGSNESEIVEIDDNLSDEIEGLRDLGGKDD